MTQIIEIVSYIINYLKELTPLTSFLLVSTFFFLSSKYLSQLFINLLLKIASKTKNEFDDMLIDSLKRPLKGAILLTGVYISSTVLDLPKELSPILNHIYGTLMIMLAGIGLLSATSHASTLIKSVSTKLGVRLDNIFYPFITRGLQFLIVFFSTSLVASEWGYDVNGLIAGLGIGGLAVALAAKDTLANLFGGVIVLADKPFSILDWIEVAGVEGTVEDINFRSTRIRTFDQALVTVPNSMVANNEIMNYSKMGKRRINFTIGLTYSTPKETVRSIVNDLRNDLLNSDDIHQETIMVYFDSFNSSSLDLFVYCFSKTTNWSEHLLVKENVNYSIMDIIEKNGASMAFPSRSLYIEHDSTK